MPDLPMRHIDHIVVAVRDLEKASDFYHRLGFQVGARNLHPWGTENRLIQFGSSFIELITVGDNSHLIPPHNTRQFSFGAFVRDYLHEREGLAMLVLSSNNAQHDAQLFAASGIGNFEVFSFERNGVKPDGTTTRVAFSLAFVHDCHAPLAGFFVCQQHFPENFWDSRFQYHPNRARNITAVTLHTPEPEKHVAFFAAFAGVEPQPHPSGGYVFAIDGSRIEVLQNTCVPPQSSLLTSFTVQVDDFQKMPSSLAVEKINLTGVDASLVIPSSSAHGAEIRFCQ